MMGPTQINAVIPSASLAQVAAFQAGFLASPTSCAHVGNSFAMSNSSLRKMTESPRGLPLARATRLFSPLTKVMATAALMACMGCVSTGIDPTNIGYTTYPKTNIHTSTGIVFEAGRPLPRYENGSIFSGILAADTKVGEFTIKAGSEVFLDESGNIIGAVPSQDIIIPVSSIEERIHDSFLESFILSYKLDVLKDGVRAKMAVEDLIEIVKKEGGEITIPANSVKVYFDDLDLDRAKFNIKSLKLSAQLELVVDPTQRIDLGKKLTPFFPKS